MIVNVSEAKTHLSKPRQRSLNPGSLQFGCGSAALTSGTPIMTVDTKFRLYDCQTI
jgi:hypothetical protein